MKRTLLTAFILLSFISVKAQEKAIAKVHYIFKHVNDTIQKEKHIRDEVVAYLGQNWSYYTSYSSTRVTEQLADQALIPNFDSNFLVTKASKIIDESYILKPTEQKLIEIKQVASDEFIIDAPYPIQNWKIQDSTKMIGGYKCQIATTTFGGRYYTAWFTMDIPFSFGPWKLHGLPGLILAAKDDKSEVEFEYSGFDKIGPDTQIAIDGIEEATFSTKEEVEKLKKAFNANPEAYRQSKANSARKPLLTKSSNKNAFASYDPSKIKSITIKEDENFKPSKEMNNPLELKL